MRFYYDQGDIGAVVENAAALAADRKRWRRDFPVRETAKGHTFRYEAFRTEAGGATIWLARVYLEDKRLSALDGNPLLYLLVVNPGRPDDAGERIVQSCEPPGGRFEEMFAGLVDAGYDRRPR
jgi:hypothetical protein